MKKITIVGLPGDVHSLEVYRALQSYERNNSKLLIEYIYPLDIGHHDTWSLDVTNKSGVLVSSRKIASLEQQPTLESHVVWFRRFAKNVTFEQYDDISVRANIEMETTYHIVGCLAARFKNALQINPIDSQSAGLKHLQLSLASEVGLKIPDTLISNDPMAIREFQKKHKDIIFKPLTGVQWKTDTGETRFTQTNRIECLNEFDDDDFIFGAGIYQPFIDKQKEVRVFVAGHTFLAMVSVPSEPSEETDWRKLTGAKIISKPIEVPADIKEKCLSLLSKEGLHFAMFDFLIYDEDWIFLEANPGGQFLFMELQCPEIYVLDAFTKFLLSGNPKFEYQGPDSNSFKYDVENEAKEPEGHHYEQFYGYDYRRVSLAGLT